MSFIRPNFYVDGVRALSKTLGTLRKSSAKKVMRSAVLAACRVVRDQGRSDIPTKFRKARADLRFRITRGTGRHRISAKVGMAVGRTSAVQKARAAKLDAGRTRGGVGISGRNFHWIVLGTKRRTTRRGQNRGVMPILLPNFMKKALSKSRSNAYRTMIRVGNAKFKIEAARLRRAARLRASRRP